MATGITKAEVDATITEKTNEIGIIKDKKKTAVKMVREYDKQIKELESYLKVWKEVAAKFSA